MTKAGAIPTPTDHAPALAEALRATLNRYVGLVESGDCGFWNPEEEKHVIRARETLRQYEGE